MRTRPLPIRSTLLVHVRRAATFPISLYRPWPRSVVLSLRRSFELGDGLMKNMLVSATEGYCNRPMGAALGAVIGRSCRPEQLQPVRRVFWMPTPRST